MDENRVVGPRLEIFTILRGKFICHAVNLQEKALLPRMLSSHSNIKTKARALPNIQKKRFFSSQLGQFLKFKVAVSAIRDIDKIGAFDTFLLRQPDSNLSPAALNAKRKILRKISHKEKPQKQKK